MTVPEGADRFLDLHLARFLASLATPPGSLPEPLVRRLSEKVRHGHVCLDLDFDGETPSPDRLMESGVVGGPGDVRPLVLHNNRLYFARHWQDQATVAGILSRLAPNRQTLSDGESDGIRRSMEILFPGETGPAQLKGGPDWQKVAAALALTGDLTVISGGPGTGKTYTVAAILILSGLLARFRGNPPPRTALATPSGKAAQRMTQSLLEARTRLEFRGDSRDFGAFLPERASTIHRLLGTRPGRSAFRYIPRNPLPLDLLVVDEVSMVDLSLMAGLLSALPPGCRVVLLGDKDQLASVEAGAVLGDLCSRDPSWTPEVRVAVRGMTGESLPPTPGPTPLSSCLVWLRDSHRFARESGIRKISLSINAGTVAEVLSVLDDGRTTDLTMASVDPGGIARRVEEEIVPFFRGIMEEETPEGALGKMGGLGVLCALREGPKGVGGINGAVERILLRQGMIRDLTPWYRGRPVLVTENHAALGLFNGDVGVIWPDPEEAGAMAAFFRESDGTVRKVSPARLPRVQTAYALTVHKSQGSEFDRVILVLPDPDVRVLTRELLYTAVTRGKTRVDLWGTRDALARGIARKTERSSGLADLLWPSRKPEGPPPDLLRVPGPS